MFGNRFRAVAAACTIAVVLLAWVPAPAIAGPVGGRIEGLLLDIEGRPAEGYRVHLIDDAGNDRAQATADEDGIYTFREVPAGRYGMGIESPQGAVAPVSSPPVRVGSGELARRDVKLVEADSATTQAAVQGHYGLGLWWSGLSTGGKAGIGVAMGAVLYGIIVALDSDGESNASDF